MYKGEIEINAANFKHLLQLADSMMMPELLRVCEVWGKDAVKEEGVTFQWLLEIHRTMQCVQAGMPDLQLQLGSSLVWACLHKMEPQGFQTLHTVLAEIWDRSSQTANPVAQMQLVRSFLYEPFDNGCPEALLLLLLLKLGQCGLQLQHLLPYLRTQNLHWEEVKALHSMELLTALASPADGLAMHNLLLAEVLRIGSPQAPCYSGAQDTPGSHLACFIPAGMQAGWSSSKPAGKMLIKGVHASANVQHVLDRQTGKQSTSIVLEVESEDHHIPGLPSKILCYLYRFSSCGVAFEPAALNRWSDGDRHGNPWNYDRYGNHNSRNAWQLTGVEAVMHDAAMGGVVGFYLA